jgi:hypothetical protein
LGVKNGERAGKLERRRSSPVHPVSATRGVEGAILVRAEEANEVGDACAGWFVREAVAGPSRRGWEGGRDKCQGKTRRGSGIQGGQMKDIGKD